MLELEEKYREALKGLKLIDLFAGIGGFRLALESFGARCVFSSEIDKGCREVYEANFGEKPAGDIREIASEEIPDFDALCGGFPCQSFSVSGKRLGFNDARGALFFEIARIAKDRRPKLLFLENVKHFERHDGGRTLKVVKAALDEIGYDVFYSVLSASKFGVPQKRERIYILAFRKDLGVKSFRFPQGAGGKTKLADFLLPERDAEKYVVERDDVVLREVKIEPDIFGDYPQRPIRVGIVNKGGQGERIYSVLGHAITLSSRGGGAGAKTGLYLTNGKIRKLAPRECARISGFPDDFLFHKSDLESYRQFGNTVVVNVLQAILKNIVDFGLSEKLLST